MGGRGMVENENTRTWAARLVAPLAFFAAATVLILLVQSGLSAGEPDTGTTPATPTTTATTEETTTTGAPTRRYRVRRGDTLESIAARFDTTVEKLIELNPDIDPLALRPGQRIRVA
jgi:LysM repeat protein